MANPHYIRIPRQPDKRVISLFKEIGRDHNVSKISINPGYADLITVETETDASDELRAVLAHDASVIESASIPIPGFKINYYRGGHKNGGGTHSPIYDDIAFEHDPQNCALTNEQRIGIVARVTKALSPLDPGRTVTGILSEEQGQLLAIHNSTLERLENLNIELVSGSEKFRRSLEKDYLGRSAELESDFRERLDTLNNEVEEKRAKLWDQESDLDKKLKEIDDRQNTHVRRELRKEILDEIRKRTKEFKLTDRTNQLRLPVYFVCWVLLLVFGAAAIYYATELFRLLDSSSPSRLAVGIIAGKQLLLSAAFGATAIFYIRWMNAWFAEHSSTEFRLRQFQLDIERASWVVESALEWKDAKGGTIPNELLEPIARNLFSPDSDSNDDVHPADELASALIGSASKVRLGIGDSEIEFNGKQLSKAKSHD